MLRKVRRKGVGGGLACSAEKGHIRCIGESAGGGWGDWDAEGVVCIMGITDASPTSPRPRFAMLSRTIRLLLSQRAA